MSHLNTRSGVKAIILRGDTVLILQKTSGRQDLPEGRLEEQETHEEALTRELFEEIGGPAVKIIGPIEAWSFMKESGLCITGTTWLCHFVSGEISLSHEHAGFCWKPLTQLKDLEIYHKYALENVVTKSR